MRKKYENKVHLNGYLVGYHNIQTTKGVVHHLELAQNSGPEMTIHRISVNEQSLDAELSRILRDITNEQLKEHGIYLEIGRGSLAQTPSGNSIVIADQIRISEPGPRYTNECTVSGKVEDIISKDGKAAVKLATTDGRPMKPVYITNLTDKDVEELEPGDFATIKGKINTKYFQSKDKTICFSTVSSRSLKKAEKQTQEQKRGSVKRR